MHKLYLVIGEQVPPLLVEHGTYTVCTKISWKVKTWYIVSEMVHTSLAQKFPEETRKSYTWLLVKWYIRQIS